MLPFFVDFPYGSLALFLFLMEDRASMMVESTTVLFSSINPFASSILTTCVNRAFPAVRLQSIDCEICRWYHRWGSDCSNSLTKIRKGTIVNNLHDAAFIGEIIELLLKINPEHPFQIVGLVFAFSFCNSAV